MYELSVEELATLFRAAQTLDLDVLDRKLVVVRQLFSALDPANNDNTCKNTKQLQTISSR